MCIKAEIVFRFLNAGTSCPALYYRPDNISLKANSFMIILCRLKNKPTAIIMQNV